MGAGWVCVWATEPLSLYLPAWCEANTLHYTLTLQPSWWWKKHDVSSLYTTCRVRWTPSTGRHHQQRCGSKWLKAYRETVSVNKGPVWQSGGCHACQVCSESLCFKCSSLWLIDLEAYLRVLASICVNSNLQTHHQGELHLYCAAFIVYIKTTWRPLNCGNQTQIQQLQNCQMHETDVPNVSFY